MKAIGNTLAIYDAEKENEDKIIVFLDERDAVKEMFLRKEIRSNKVRFHQTKTMSKTGNEEAQIGNPGVCDL